MKRCAPREGRPLGQLYWEMRRRKLRRSGRRGKEEEKRIKQARRWLGRERKRTQRRQANESEGSRPPVWKGKNATLAMRRSPTAQPRPGPPLSSPHATASASAPTLQVHDITHVQACEVLRKPEPEGRWSHGPRGALNYLRGRAGQALCEADAPRKRLRSERCGTRRHPRLTRNTGRVSWRAPQGTLRP
jgi:hypothetical protein